MPSLRELKNLRIVGEPALIDGYVPDRTAQPRYYYRGAWYEHDGSAQSVEWAAQGANMARLPTGYYRLEAIIGELNLDGRTWYLAAWSVPYERDPTWEVADCFQPHQIARWDTWKAQQGVAVVGQDMGVRNIDGAAVVRNVTNNQTTNDERTDNERTNNERITNERITNERASDEKASIEKVSNEKVSNEKVSNEKVSNEKASNDRTNNERVTD